MTQGRVEALISVPSGVTVSASNSGGGATSVSLTADSYFWSAAGTTSGLAAHIQSQLNSLRAPSSGSWTVTVSTDDGRVSIGCTGTTAIPSFSLAWTSTTLRDLLGFTRDIDYPSTAAQMATDLGYGTWTSGVGYLCNEASGNLSPVFGSGTLVATNTPTYGSTGPRGGSDKAVGCGASGSSLGSFVASSSALCDASATDDILVVLVVESFGSGGTFGYMPIKGNVGATPPYWGIIQTSNTRLTVNDGTNSIAASITTPTAPCILVGALSRSTNKMAFGAQTLTTGAGAQTVSSLVGTTGLGTLSNADFLRLGPGDNTSALKIAAFYCVTGSGVATGVPENLSTALANFAATFGTRTGTKQARGLWLPKCVVNMDQDPAMAPLVTDLRTTQSPTGVVLGLTGNSYCSQTGLYYSHVPKAQVREAAATYANGSLETFLKDSQFGLGHAWLSVSSPIQIYTHSGVLVGSDLNSGAGTDGWYITGVDRIKPKLSVDGWAEYYRIELPTLVSPG